MFQEGNQRGCNRHYLFGRHVHVFNFGRIFNGKFVAVTNGNQIVDQLVVLVRFRRGLSDYVLGLVDRGQKLNLVSNLAINNLAVGTFQEAVFVGARVSCQRVDQTDVRAFRRLDWADTAVVGRMHVAHFEAGALTGQTTRTKRRNAALVSDF